MGHTATERYRVSIWGCLDGEDRLGSLDVEQTFGSRKQAERFAAAISHHIPSGTRSNGCARAWVLVYALPDPSQGVFQHSPGHCYLCFDYGAVVVKRHSILRGHYGYARFEHRQEMVK